MVNVTTEQTPNPATMKFLPGTVVMPSGTANFASADAAATSPLAMRLFEVPGVAGVFLGADFVSVAKREAVDWADLETRIAGEISAHFDSGLPVITEPQAEVATDDDDEIVTQIRELLDTRIRPSVALDGGDIVYRGFERGVVFLSLQGACLGCPSSSATLKMGVENLLKHYVPDVLRVEAVA